MSTWTTSGTPEPAGDAFGDNQHGDALSLTYTAPDRPNERVIVTFGVILNRAGRYSGETLISHEVRRNGEWDNPPGVTPVNDNSDFLQDHDSLNKAHRDRDQALRTWASQSFTDPELHIN